MEPRNHEIKDFKFEVKQIAEDGTFEGYLSVFNIVDACGDLVEKGAFTKTLSEQKEFPLLWSHNYMEPIGTFTGAEDEYGLKINGALNLDISKGKEVYSNIKKRIVKGLSIGYDSIQKIIESGVRRLKEVKLWEGSLCLFPACDKAVVTSFKSVIGYHDYGAADEAAAWDGPAAMKADVEVLKKICAWYDEANADVKSSYKLPHHDPDGLKAVWRGVAAAMAALLGARGGVQIPDVDRKAVYAHLSKHYSAWDKTPPDFKFFDSISDSISALTLELKEGRVISKSNLALISKAIEALSALLEAAQPADATGKSGEPPAIPDKPDIHLLGAFEELKRLKQFFTEEKQNA
jgi:uncharacterized protein